MSRMRSGLIQALRDKKTNNIVVGVILALGLTDAISFLTNTFYGPGWSQWWSEGWRQLVGLGVTLIVAELISRIAKD